MSDPNKPDNTSDTSAQSAWDDALQEPSRDEPSPAADDPWSEALAEQKAADETDPSDAPTAASRTAGDAVFRPLDGSRSDGKARDLEMIMDIPVSLSVELGRTRLTIKELLELAQGSVVELDGLPGEPMDILINGYLIAQGEVVVVEDKYGIRISEIVTPSARLQKLNR
ncbi:MAG TPA: flagellar motor switch protein FliN [Oleiagrimonas sp.]|nr:flagellar motor switch protein FliN [Oleiagrimonas sp.]